VNRRGTPTTVPYREQERLMILNGVELKELLSPGRSTAHLRGELLELTSTRVVLKIFP
jgi:hypothetical protein